MDCEIETFSQDQTIKLGSLLAKFLKRGMVVTLDGDLGAGKTTFTKGLGKGLDIDATISSPTFNILKCYFNGNIPLYHIDAYRLEDGTNTDIGLEEVIEGNGVAVIEWSCFIKEMIHDHLEVKIQIISDSERKINFVSYGDKYDEIIARLKEIKL